MFNSPSIRSYRFTIVVAIFVASLISVITNVAMADPDAPCNISLSHPDCDQDSDNLTNSIELAAGLDPKNPDSDSDGINDGIEDINLNGVFDAGESHPLNPCDPDATGLFCTVDSDGDGVTDGLEQFAGSNSRLVDSDGDGIDDGAEDSNKNGIVDATESSSIDPCEPKNTVPACVDDSDGDGIKDGYEIVAGTNPNSADTDGDDLSDGYAEGTTTPADSDPLDPCVPDNQADSCTEDTDGDGLSDGIELVYGSDLNDVDTDGDGTHDNAENDKYGIFDTCDPSVTSDLCDQDGDGVTVGDGDENDTNECIDENGPVSSALCGDNGNNPNPTDPANPTDPVNTSGTTTSVDVSVDDAGATGLFGGGSGCGESAIGISASSSLSLFALVIGLLTVIRVRKRAAHK